MPKTRPKPLLKPIAGGDQRRIRITTHLTLVAKRFNPSVPAHITNVSVGGAFLETVPEREGRIIDITFSFPGDPRVFSVTARVMWISQGSKQPPGFGIRFLRFHSGSAAELQEIISEFNRVEKHRKQKENFQILNKPEVSAHQNIDAVIEGYWDKFLQ